MSARQDLPTLLQEWRQLTEAEAGAIQSASWPKVKEIQSAKDGLKESITRAMGEWNAKNPGAHPFEAEVGRLISLETRNGQLLAEQRQQLQLQQASADEAMRNLRKVQKSYGRKSDSTREW